METCATEREKTPPPPPPPDRCDRIGSIVIASAEGRDARRAVVVTRIEIGPSSCELPRDARLFEGGAAHVHTSLDHLRAAH